MFLDRIHRLQVGGSSNQFQQILDEWVFQNMLGTLHLFFDQFAVLRGFGCVRHGSFCQFLQSSGSTRGGFLINELLESFLLKNLRFPDLFQAHLDTDERMRVLGEPRCGQQAKKKE